MKKKETEYNIDYIDTIRTMIQHENKLINDRMAWMWTLQGLLYGSMSFLWVKDSSAVIVVIISFVGLISCLSIGYSLYNANLAIDNLRKKADKCILNLKKEISVKCVPPYMGYTKGSRIILPWIILPWIFGLSWVTIIVVKLFF